MSASTKLSSWQHIRFERSCRICRQIPFRSAHLTTIDLTRSKPQSQQGSKEIAKIPLRIPSSSLSYHWETLPPTEEQLQYADKFFTKRAPTFLWSAPKFATMSFGNAPEVCFLGRSNVGKSSLLNALLGQKIAYTSSKPGRTRLMNAFGVGEAIEKGKYPLVVLDMPGYGKGSQAEWGTEILKYLEQRKELRRAFLLIDTTHGVKSSDELLLGLFRERGIPHQIVLSKVDRLFFPKSRDPSQKTVEFRSSELRQLMEGLRNVIQPEIDADGVSDEESEVALGEIIACSAEREVEKKKMGIDAVRHAILQAVELELHPVPVKQRNTAAAIKLVPHEEIWGKEISNG